MRKKLCAVVMVTALLLSGCGPSVPDLTHVNNDIAAQYVADALLRKDKNYDEGIDYDHSLLQPTPTPEPTQAPVKEVAEDDKTGGNGSAGNGSQNQGSGTDAGSGSGGATVGGDNGQPGNGSGTNLANATIAEVFGTAGVTVTPVSYQLKSSYGSSSYQVLPHKGNKLAIVYFMIANTSGKKQRVNLTKQQFSAELLVNGDSVGKPLQTFASSDLQLMDIKLEAGQKKQGVLLFEVDKGTKVKDVTVRFSTDTKEASVPVK